MVGPACTNSPTAEDHFHLGEAQDGAGNTDGAIAEFRETLRLNAQEADSHNYNLTDPNHKQGVEGMKDVFQEASRLNAEDADAHYRLGGALESQGKYQEALDEFRKACQLKPNDSDSCVKAKKLSGEVKQS